MKQRVGFLPITHQPSLSQRAAWNREWDQTFLYACIGLCLVSGNARKWLQCWIRGNIKGQTLWALCVPPTPTEVEWRVRLCGHFVSLPPPTEVEWRVRRVHFVGGSSVGVGLPPRPVGGSSVGVGPPPRPVGGSSVGVGLRASAPAPLLVSPSSCKHFRQDCSGSFCSAYSMGGESLPPAVG